MYDPYEPPRPNDQKPDDPGPKWERFEPRAPSGGPASSPTPTGRIRFRRRAGIGPKAAPPGPGSLVAGTAGLLVVAGLVGAVVSQTNEPEPLVKPAGWDSCVVREAAEIVEERALNLTPEGVCEMTFSDYDWASDPDYVPYFDEHPEQDPRRDNTD